MEPSIHGREEESSSSSKKYTIQIEQKISHHIDTLCLPSVVEFMEGSDVIERGEISQEWKDFGKEFGSSP